jgi:hypothetical protein
MTPRVQQVEQPLAQTRGMGADHFSNAVVIDWRILSFIGKGKYGMH